MVLPPFVLSGRIPAAAVTEASGLAASRLRPGIFWTHGDSGSPARLVGVRLDGSVAATRDVIGATNVDWEDVATDGGTIWIGEFGNNDNARRDLALYAVPERGGAAVRYPIAYPDQSEFPPKLDRRFDAEALFVRRGKPYVLTKWRIGPKFPGSGAALYRMDTRFRDRPNVLTRLGAKADFGGWVTAASLSPSGRELAVLTHLPIAAIWIFDADVPDDRLLTRPSARLALGSLSVIGQVESLAWNGDREIVFGNEGGDLFRVSRTGIPPVRQDGQTAVKPAKPRK